MIRINLLPVKAVQKKEKLIGQLAVLSAAVVLAVGVCVGAYVSVQMKISAEEEAIAEKEAEINRLKKVLGEVGKFKKLQQELQGKLDVLDKLKEGKSGPVHLLEELSRATPGKLWVTSFKEARGNIAVDGVGLNEETVAEFLQELEASPYYRNVELKVTEQVTQFGMKLQKFSLTCNHQSPSKQR